MFKLIYIMMIIKIIL